ncbi:OpgC domain-containing protein [Enterovibrio sp. ZSDZ42]|uniref:OpgC domain-containing protein n=1 Tax=Enterovibrio gelatinilyticus TaxID=2899819 RepID=A0ABT5R2L2_9GAMM|nr:OpgC domain-containing protein [Enterovibrio sp. ZSDZ42]MDD1794512.1 OpgC domain-containing protein [Enterovibrio sp. ZSDZ42]
MNRIPALDSIRGLLLVIMTINHLIWISGGRSVLQYFSLQPLGQFGAAEGFVFISGLLAGAVYCRSEYSNRETTQKVLNRAFTIYKYHIASLFIVMLWFSLCIFAFPSAATSLGSSFNNLLEAPIATIALSALLINRPDFLEILPLYIMFMLILPLVLVAFRKGYLWLVLAGSVVVWAFSGSITSSALSALLTSVAPNFKAQFGYFDPFAWQLLFVSGAALGFKQRQGTLNWHHPIITGIAGLFAIGMFAAHHGTFLSWGIHQGVLYNLADKPELGWLRLLNLAAWIYLIAVVIRTAPNALVFKPLGYVGQYSLQVFTWQTVLIFACAPFLNSVRLSPYYTALVLACTATLWVVAWWQDSRNKASNTLPKTALLASTFALILAASFVSTRQDASPAITEVLHVNQSYPLTVTVKDIKEDDADMILLIYTDADDLTGAPSEHFGTYTTEQMRNGVTLAPIQSGDYAILVFQDLDKNMMLSLNASGFPSEGFGFSNNPILQGPPTFDMIKFSHNKTQAKTIHMVNMY